MDPGAGRARGRGARSRPGFVPSETEAEAMAEGGDEGSEAALRGRGGLSRFRAQEVLKTIPSHITATAGEGGTMVRLCSNYFRLLVPTDQVIYSYRVDFEPQVESVRARRGMIYENRAVFDRAYIYDGGSEIKSLTQLPQESTTVTATRRTDNATITITIRYTSTVTWGHPEMLRLYNTQMRRNLQHIGMMQIGRDYFDKNARRQLPQWNVEIWPGIITAINEHDGGLLMVNDLINKIVRKETAYDFLQNILRTDRANLKQIARRDLPGKIVLTTYNNKTYRIDDVVFDKNPTTYTFERRTGEISLKDYYREQYQVTLTDERQPLLMVRPTERQRRGGEDKPIVLVPELCLMTGLTEEMKNNFDFKKELGNLTRLDPNARAQNLNKFIRKLIENSKVKEEMSAWGLRFEEKIIELPGRILPGEKIYMHGDADDGGTPYQQKTGSFDREIRSKVMRRPAAIESWALICQRRDKPLIDEYCQTLRRVAEPLGVALSPPKIFPLDNDRVQTYIDACKKIPPQAKLVNIIVPNNNKERYDGIKKIFCCEQPCASQVVTNRILTKKAQLMTICTKICIQMSVKLGAEAWALNIPPRNMMVIGYDTYHDSARKGYSVGGFTCSVNQSATRWFSRVSYHQNREEMSSNFAANFRAGIKEYHSKNQRYPERIIIYRDGVSEGQIGYVYNIEIKQLEAVLKESEATSKIAWAFVIVTKRVNARFFLKVNERQLENPTSGTIADTVVTRKERYDFYLISQSVRQGTVNPTMYNIIADNTSWRPVHHQQIAYKLCHLYYNWAGTITVPAPCQYAHKLAYLTGTSLHREPSVALSDTLFYL